MEFYTGMAIELDGECTGTVTAVEETRIFIKSDAFCGWADKTEILAAIIQPAKSGQSPSTRPQRPTFAA